MCLCVCVCDRARFLCECGRACEGTFVRARTRAGAYTSVRAGARTCVRAREYVRVCESVHLSVCACASACVVGEHACALQWASSRTCGCACWRAGAYIFKLCRPLTYRHANYQSKNYCNHNHLQ